MVSKKEKEQTLTLIDVTTAKYNNKHVISIAKLFKSTQQTDIVYDQE